MEARSVAETPVTDTQDARREAMRQVLASRTFSKSPRLCSLLEYVVENTLTQNLDELTEQYIGIQVFGRSPGYNSADDTIVRGTARHLRQRLEQYYQTEGHADTLRVTIPKGSYIAHFEKRGTDPVHDTQLPRLEINEPLPPIAPASFGTAWPRSARVLVCVLGLLTILLPLAMYRWLRPTTSSVSLKGPQPLWQALFTPDRKTLIVPGDASLDAYTAWEQRRVTLDDYANQNYQRNVTVSRPPTNTDVPLSVRSVTPMADLRFVAELVRAPEHMGMPQLEHNIEIRYARDVAVADTHDNNLILIGSETFNPWVMLYQNNMDFAAHWDEKADIYSVDNKAPKPGEQAHYYYGRGKPTEQMAVTHIALIDNSQGQGRVLIVEGTSMGTTYGAVNFLTHEHLWKPVLTAATDSNGRLHNFEVLLSGTFLHGGISNSQILAVHVH
jgi:hypothetical protein